MLVFFLGFLPPSRGLALRCIFGMVRSFSERLFAGVVVLLAAAAAGGGSGGRSSAGRVALPAAGTRAALAAIVAVDLGGRPAQARADLVGHDLDHAALLAVLRLVRALL